MYKEIRKIVKTAIKRGWRQLPNGKHHVLQHVASGRKLSVSMSPSDGNAYRQLERAIRRVEKEVGDADVR